MAVDQNTTVQVITTTQIMGIGGVSAIAGSMITLIGIWLKSIFEAKENRKTRFFEARRKAYTGLIGHLNNSFAKYDIPAKDYTPETIIQSMTNYSVNLDYEFADSLLLCGGSVKAKIEEYKQGIFSLRGAVLSDANRQKLHETFKSRVQQSVDIHKVAKELIDMMRKELEVQ